MLKQPCHGQQRLWRREDIRPYCPPVLISACLLGIPCRWHGRRPKRRDKLRQKSGVPEKRFEERLNTLTANRVLYPDGTINSFVRRYLRQKVLRLLGVDAKTRRELKAPAEAPPAR